MTACRQTGGDMALQQLRILHGDPDAVTAMSVGPLGPFPSLACAARGSLHLRFYPEYGPSQRFGVTPNGSDVVFEASDEFAREGCGLLPAEQRGIYHVRVHGSGLHRRGPAGRSRSPPVRYSGGLSRSETASAFDASGQKSSHVDRGPDEAGEEAAQVFAQRLTRGEPSRQVTRGPGNYIPGQFPEIRSSLFVGARTIAFARADSSTVPAARVLQRVRRG